MKKLLTIFFLSIYLIGTTEAYQLLKMPLMVMHFVQHSKEDPAMGLVKFLKIHYAETPVFDADWQQDMQLPFKSHEDNASLIQLSYFPPFVASLLMHTRQEVVAILGGQLQVFHVGIYMPDIFQPPRG